MPQSKGTVTEDGRAVGDPPALIFFTGPCIGEKVLYNCVSTCMFLKDDMAIPIILTRREEKREAVYIKKATLCRNHCTILYINYFSVFLLTEALSHDANY